MIWEYDENDLITLCKQCHTSLHANEEIPVYDMYGNFLENRIYLPEDYSCGRNHDYKPWIFIRKDKKKGEYVVADINPRVSYVLLSDEDPEEIEKITTNMVAEFFIRFLPSYKK